MTSALVRKSWTDLSRRPTRSVLTVLTLALAVASFGILAVPSLMNRAMVSEVSQARLYDVAVPIDAAVLPPAEMAGLARLPNVTAVTGRSVFVTRAQIGTKRVDAEVYGVPDFTDQPVDQVIAARRPQAGQVLVDVRDSMAGITDARSGDILDVQAADGTYRSVPVAGSARGLAFNQDAMSGHLILYADQTTVQSLGGFRVFNRL